MIHFNVANQQLHLFEQLMTWPVAGRTWASKIDTKNQVNEENPFKNTIVIVYY